MIYITITNCNISAGKKKMNPDSGHKLDFEP